MQRLFSAFPTGAAGAGILLLRLTLGTHLALAGALTIGAVARTMGASDLVVSAIGVLWVVAGLLTLVGLMTPVAQGVVLVSMIVMQWLSALAPALAVLSAQLPAPITLPLAVCASLIVLGPGAYSIDAYLFGRREIRIPPKGRGDRVDSQLPR